MCKEFVGARRFSPSPPLLSDTTQTLICCSFLEQAESLTADVVKPETWKASEVFVWKRFELVPCLLWDLLSFPLSGSLGSSSENGEEESQSVGESQGLGAEELRQHHLLSGYFVARRGRPSDKITFKRLPSALGRKPQSRRQFIQHSKNLQFRQVFNASAPPRRSPIKYDLGSIHPKSLALRVQQLTCLT